MHPTNLSDTGALYVHTRNRLADQVYERLLELMLTGGIPAGQVISERRLAERLDISRTPLRDAMRQLESEGLLERLAEGRMQVRILAAADYMDNLHARRLIEAETARLATGRLRAPLMASLRRRLVPLLDGTVDPDDPPWRIDADLHDAIAAAAGNARLRAIARQLHQEAHLVDPRRLPDRIRRGTVEHLALLDALECGTPEEAAAAMRHHLDQVKHDFLALLATDEPPR